MLRDHDFHPDETTVRVFRTPPAGVLRFDDSVLVTETRHEDIVLRHYAFDDRWFKVNVTTDLDGRLVEMGEPGHAFTFNCDIATPMERDGDDVYAVDLFVDVLVRADGRTFVVADEDELAEAVAADLVSPHEVEGVAAGLADLLTVIERGDLVAWLHEIVPFGACNPPVAPDMERRPVPDRLSRSRRP